MIKRIIKILIMGLLFMGLLSLGGYTLNSFKSEVHLRDPQSVLSPLAQTLPDLPKGRDIIGSLPSYENEGGGDTTNPTNPSDNQVADSGDNGSGDGGNKIDLPDFTTDPGISDPGGPFGNGNKDSEITDPGNPVDGPDITTDPGITDPGTPSSGGNDSYVDENGNIIKKDIKLPDNIEISYAKAIKIKIDDKEIEVTSKNTAEFVRWLNNNWHAGADVSFTVDKEEPTPTEGSESTETGELTYDTTLSNSANLNALANSITIIDSLPEYDDYDRNTYEKPTQSYMLDGKKVNRNDYAWKTSPWYNAEDNTYMCPYTGTVIHDLDDKKEDNDFGNLDYDHIVPLKSAYLRGARDWTEEQRNAYAYDQWVGVDVLNSANRSKSDKGPCDYLPDINVEDYCYSWLMICSKYNLSMTQEEIDLCMDYINIALENGEEVTFLGGSYEE